MSRAISSSNIKNILLVLALFLMLCSNTVFSYERKVLVEVFTNTGCPICGQYIPPMQDMLYDQIDSATFIEITYHTWWPSNSDRWYLENYERHLPEFDDTRTRMDWLGVDQFMGVPSFFFDGTYMGHNYTVNQFVNRVRDTINTYRQIETPISIEINAGAYRNELRTTITVTSTESFDNLTLFTALCEVYSEYDAPSGQSDYYGNILDFIPTANGEVFSIDGDDSVTMRFTGSLDVGPDENVLDNLQVVAWVQKSDLTVMQSEVTAIAEIPASILVVDATGNLEAGSIMIGSFGCDSVPDADRWDRVDEGLVYPELLTDYEVVIWHTFNNDDDIINEDEQAGLIEFLDLGGSLVLSSPYLCREIDDSPFYRDYLGILPDQPNTGVRMIHSDNRFPEFADCQVYLGGDGGAGSPQITPSIRPRPGSLELMNYVSGNRNIGIAAVQHSTETFRTLALAFPIESIAGAAGTDTRAEFLCKLCDWIQSPLQINPERSVMPNDITLSPIYPNPFNSTTHVQFSSNKTGVHYLDVYDIVGRKVYGSNLGSLTAGTHSFPVNLSDTHLGSGIYTITLTSGSIVRSNRAVYLK